MLLRLDCQADTSERKHKMRDQLKITGMLLPKLHQLDKPLDSRERGLYRFQIRFGMRQLGGRGP